MTRRKLAAIGSVGILALAGLGSALVVSGSHSPANSLPLTKVSETSNKVTYSWTPKDGQGYVYFKDGTRISNTWDATVSQATFAKTSGTHVYEVWAVDDIARGSATLPTPTGTTTTTTTTTPTTTTSTTPPVVETMGETSVLPSGDSGNGNHIFAQQAGLVQDGTLQSLSFYVTSAVGKLRLAVYDSTGPGGNPGALVAQTNEFTPVVGWNTASVTSQVPLVAAYYWLAYLPSDNGLGFKVGSGGVYKGYAYTYGTPPPTFNPTATGGPSHWSFYATLAQTGGSGGGNPGGGGTGTPTTRLAWFYSRALDGTTPLTIVQRHQVMILSGSDSEVGYLSSIKAAGWTKPILEYVDAQFAMGPSSGCPAGYAGFTTTWTSSPDEFCNKVNPNEGYFLHNGAGKRIFRDAGGGNYYYLMNPASAGWRAYIQAKTATLPSTFHMDGVFLDDVWATAVNARSRETDSDGTCQECGSDAQWLASTRLLLQAVKAGAGSQPVWINSDDTSTLPSLVDGFMIENMGASWGTSFMSQSETQQRMADVDSNTNAGKDTLLVGQGNQADVERMRYSHALYLLVSGPHVSYRFQNAGDYRSFWDYPEYKLDLGTPLGARYQVGNSVWRRDFSNGTVIANLSDTTGQTVALGASYKNPNGATVTTVNLDPDHGMTLTK